MPRTGNRKPEVNLLIIVKKLFLLYKSEIISLHLKNIRQNILPKKKYHKPEVVRIVLDSSISFVMMSPPINPDPRSGNKKGNDTPFQSPFGDKPFS
jgi:hypothetical protein